MTSDSRSDEVFTAVRAVARAQALMIILLLTAGCQAPFPQRDPTGEPFPIVSGRSLEGQEIELPRAVAGEPVLLLIGFLQETQFDLDRWALALWQLGLEVRVLEVPTIVGLVPSLLSERIDRGMRSGIPSEDWSTVVTVYEDSDTIAQFTGNMRPRPGRILLLDAEGLVVFFHDRGYSTSAIQRLSEALDALKNRKASPSQDTTG
jgi:hypothetical protein